MKFFRAAANRTDELSELSTSLFLVQGRFFWDSVDSLCVHVYVWSGIMFLNRQKRVTFYSIVNKLTNKIVLIFFSLAPFNVTIFAF